MRYEKDNYKFTSNESLASALEYNFLISRNNTLIKTKKQRHSVTVAITTHDTSIQIQPDHCLFYLPSHNAHWRYWREPDASAFVINVLLFLWIYPTGKQ